MSDCCVPLAIGGYDSDITRMQDRELLLRFARRGGALLSEDIDWKKYNSENSISGRRDGYVAAYAGWRTMFWLGAPLALASGKAKAAWRYSGAATVHAVGTESLPTVVACPSPALTDAVVAFDDSAIALGPPRIHSGNCAAPGPYPVYGPLP